ncbi:MAG TPA: hypothetical protein VNI77_08880 [Nitrososphaera sp.]|nr:hypothetical protein [Nitrososphaera sp.]
MAAEEELKHLSAADPRLAAIIESVGPYEIRLRKDPFPLTRGSDNLSATRWQDGRCHI